MQLDTLVAIDIPEAVFKEYMRDEGVGRLYHAERCAYHLLIGTADMLAAVPDLIKELAKHSNQTECRILSGTDAYAHSLQVLCGLKEQNRMGDTAAVDTIHNRWGLYCRENSDISAHFKRTVDNLFTDSSKIRGEFLENKLCAVGTELAITGRKMAGILRRDVRKGRGAEVALVANDVEHTRTLGKILGQHCGTLWVTHPDTSTLQEIGKNLRQMRRDGKIEAAIETVPFEDALTTALPVAHHIFIDRPLLGDEVDQQLLASCVTRLGKGMVIQLHGNQMGDIPAAWAHISNQLSPLLMREQQSKDRAANQEQFRLAEQACFNSAQSRNHGKQPIKKNLHLPGDDYRHLSGLASTASRSRA